VRAALVRLAFTASRHRADLKIEEIPDRDWLAEWKKGWQPVEPVVFIVAPPWVGRRHSVNAGFADG
jgi:ribosomal protein L11 methylase PrmA